MYVASSNMNPTPSRVAHSVRPGYVVSLNRGLSGAPCCGLAGIPAGGMGAISFPTTALGIGALGLAGLVLFKFLKGRKGGRSSALRKAGYKAAAERYAILARS